MINGISVSGLSEFVDEVARDPAEGCIAYGVRLDWETGTRSKVTTLPMTIGRHRVPRDFSWTIDEPRQLLGLNHSPNPQEYLLSGVGGCLLVGYAVGASVMGIVLDTLEVTVQGELDCRGFLHVADEAGESSTGEPSEIPVAFKSITYRVTIGGDGTDEQFAFLHDQVAQRSPNRMTIARGVPITGELTIARPTTHEASASE